MTTTEQAARSILKARISLLINSPFWGQLALRLNLVVDPTCKTAWTDSKSLGYNPDFIVGLSHDELVGLVAHEVSHVAHGHCWRRGDRDKSAWNIAADRAINTELSGAGFTLPSGALYGDNRSAEQQYEAPNDSDDNGDNGESTDSGDSKSGESESESSDNDPGQCGECRDLPTDSGEQSTEAIEAAESAWHGAIVQSAKAAESRGSLPGIVKALIESSQPKYNPWPILMRHIQTAICQSDYTWNRPHVAHLQRGIVLPTCREPRIGHLTVAVDTSGSVADETLAKFLGHIAMICGEVRPKSIRLIQCDASIEHDETTEDPDDLIVADLPIAGRGGTRFIPVFEAIESGESPTDCLVYLTDTYGDFPDRAPDYPVIWATVGAGQECPFGEQVQIV